MVRRLPNGNFIGRYALYFPTTAYRNQVQGHYNPLDFTGSVIYTDLNGNYTHGFKLENGQIIGTATATKSDGRLTSGLRGCLSITVCISQEQLPFDGERCMTIMDCTFHASGANIPPPGTGSGPGGGWNDGGSAGGNSGGGGGGTTTQPSSVWASNQPPIVLGELSYEARQFLTTKGFSEFQMDWLAMKPNLLDQVLNYMRTDGSVEGALVSRQHVDLYVENVEYRNAMIAANYPLIGTDSWANAAWEMVKDEGWGDLTAEEQRMARANSGEFMIYALSAQGARIETRLRYNGHQDGTISNSFQHAYWNALLTTRMSQRRAREWTNAHEFGQNGIGTQMDLFNNAVGITIADSEFNGSQSLSGMIFRAVSEGRMRYICNGQLIPTNQGC